MTGRIVAKRRWPGTRLRGGLSLLEVLLATVILASAMAALGPLVTTGLRGALVARRQAEAEIRAASIVGELVAGVRKTEPVAARPFDDDARWTWSLAITPQDGKGVALAVVQVERAGDTTTPPLTFRVARLVRPTRADPVLGFDSEAER